MSKHRRWKNREILIESLKLKVEKQQKIIEELYFRLTVYRGFIPAVNQYLEGE